MCPSPAKNNHPESPAESDRGSKFPRSLSLKSRGRIREGLRTFKRRSGKNLTVFYNVQSAESASLDSAVPLKWVFMVPKRTGTAVIRNRIRRQLREKARLWSGRKNLSGEIMVRFEPGKRKPTGALALPRQIEFKQELLTILAVILSKTCEN